MKDQIKALLQSNQGPVWSVKSLAFQTRHHLGHETGPAIRKIIRELIAEGCPIGSNNAGYFWIKNKDQLDESLSSLQSRCDKINERIFAIRSAYQGERNSRHLNEELPTRARCRAYVVYLAEESGIPYQAVWALAYRKFTKHTGVDTCNLSAHYRGSVLNYIVNRGMAITLYHCLEDLEGALL